MRVRQVSCDVAIIGAGTAGLSARAAAIDAGAKTLLIEAGPGGTTCARVGCMPSKLLIAAAAAAHGVRHADLFGIEAGPPRIDGAAVMARVQRERDHFVASVLADMENIPDEEKLAGRARFLGPTTLAVDDHTQVDARAIVIATGSLSQIPKSFQRLGDRVLTNETIFELKQLPGSLAVIGAGPLGIELAQAVARLDVAVTVFDKGTTIGGLRDPKVAAAARELIGAELELKLGIEPSPGTSEIGVELSWTTSERQECRRFDYVLVAAGRAPNLAELDLGKAGLTMDEHGTPVFDKQTLRCGDSAIFIAGDANHHRPVLHEAANEGRIAGLNAARFPDVKPAPQQTPLAIVYTDPEIAIVGQSFSDGHDVVVDERDLHRSGRARVQGRNAGLLRVYASQRDHRLLGGALVGPEVEHLAHLLAWAVQLGLTAPDLLALPFYHPSLEESLRGAVRQICKDAQAGGVRAASLSFGPGS